MGTGGGGGSVLGGVGRGAGVGRGVERGTVPVGTGGGGFVDVVVCCRVAVVSVVAVVDAVEVVAVFSVVRGAFIPGFAAGFVAIVSFAAVADGTVSGCSGGRSAVVIRGGVKVVAVVAVVTVVSVVGATVATVADESVVDTVVVSVVSVRLQAARRTNARTRSFFIMVRC